MKRALAGTTRKFTWVNSGLTVTTLSAAILDGSDTVVTSSSMTSSGGGHYYADLTLPSSEGFYVALFSATIGGKPYYNRIPFRTTFEEVD